MEHALYRSGFTPATKPVRELIRTRHIRFMETAERVIKMKEARVLIVWMPEKLSPLRIPKAKSRELIRLGYATMETLFGKRRL